MTDILDISPRTGHPVNDPEPLVGWLDRLYNIVARGKQGVWTPVDASVGALTLSAIEGTYTKFGNIVIAKAALTYPVTADGNNAKIGGLPYMSKATGTITGGNLIYTNSAVANKILLNAAGATVFNFYTAAGVAVTNAQMSATTNYVEIIYPVS